MELNGFWRIDCVQRTCSLSEGSRGLLGVLHAQGEGIKVKKPWLEIKEGKPCSLLRCASLPGDLVGHRSNSQRFQNLCSGCRAVGSLLLYPTVRLWSQRGGRTVTALGTVAWIGDESVITKQGTLVLGFGRHILWNFRWDAYISCPSL